LENQTSPFLVSASPSKESKTITDDLVVKASFQPSDYLEYLKRVAPLLNMTNEKTVQGKYNNF